MGKNKEHSLFFKIYITVVAIFMVLLIVGAIVLCSVLKAYEVTRPKHAAKEVFEKYFTSFNIGGLMKYTGAAAMYEDAEKVNSGVKKLYENAELKYFSVSSTDNTEVYAVTADGTRIAYFTLSETDRKEGFGMHYYELTGAELFLPSSNDVLVRVPVGYSLMINGIAADTGIKLPEQVEGESCKYVSGSAEGIKYDVYTIKGLFYEPEITAFTPEGKSVDVNYNENEKCYIADVAFDEAFGEEQSNYILNAATAYTTYMSKDASFDKIAKYLDKSSELYTRIRSIAVTWVSSHSGYNIYDVNINEFYRYSEDIYSCRVRLTESLHRAGHSDHVEHIDVYFYLHKVNGEYLIYEIVSNS